MSFPWYEVIDPSSTLNQGDLIKACPVFIPPSEIKSGMSIDVKVVKYNVIILTQSCDLVNSKLSTALVCYYMSFRDYISNLYPGERSRDKVENQFKQLRKGLQPRYHLLDQDKDKGIPDHLVVDFGNVFSVDIGYLNQHVAQQSERVRLRPPYREQLSQSFARFFMRVGLPQDINDIDGRNYK